MDSCLSKLREISIGMRWSGFDGDTIADRLDEAINDCVTVIVKDARDFLMVGTHHIDFECIGYCACPTEIINIALLAKDIKSLNALLCGLCTKADSKDNGPTQEERITMDELINRGADQCGWCAGEFHIRLYWRHYELLTCMGLGADINGLIVADWIRLIKT